MRGEDSRFGEQCFSHALIVSCRASVSAKIGNRFGVVTNNFRMITAEILAKIRLLVDAVKRQKDGKPLTQEQVKLVAALNPKRGRPRDEIVWPIFDTMAQCSAATGVPVAVLRESKRAGCPAFKHSRIYFGPFLRWLFENMDDQSTDWGKDLEKSKALRERIKLAEDERRVVDRNTIADGIAKGMAYVFGELDRVFVGELPARGKGMDELKLRTLACGEIERMKEQLRRTFENLSEGKPI